MQFSAQVLTPRSKECRLQRKFYHMPGSDKFGLRVNLAKQNINGTKMAYEIKRREDRKIVASSELFKSKNSFILEVKLPAGSYEVFLHNSNRLIINSIEMLSSGKLLFMKYKCEQDGKRVHVLRFILSKN